jgi:2-polyprenyl-3-methyl-5-hydroxy-6-metoxy-1,4-benzoquinol methylase
MEVIEHVNNPEAFLGSLSDLCNPEGMLFVSTINKTIASYL